MSLYLVLILNLCFVFGGRLLLLSTYMRFIAHLLLEAPGYDYQYCTLHYSGWESDGRCSYHIYNEVTCLLWSWKTMSRVMVRMEEMIHWRLPGKNYCCLRLHQHYPVCRPFHLSPRIHHKLLPTYTTIHHQVKGFLDIAQSTINEFQPVRCD